MFLLEDERTKAEKPATPSDAYDYPVPGGTCPRREPGFSTLSLRSTESLRPGSVSESLATASPLVSTGLVQDLKAESPGEAKG